MGTEGAKIRGSKRPGIIRADISRFLNHVRIGDACTAFVKSRLNFMGLNSWCVGPTRGKSPFQSSHFKVNGKNTGSNRIC